MTNTSTRKRASAIWPLGNGNTPVSRNEYSGLRNKMIRTVSLSAYRSLQTDEEKKMFLKEACEEYTEARAKKNIPSNQPDLDKLVEGFFAGPKRKELEACAGDTSQQMQHTPALQQTGEPVASQQMQHTPALQQTGEPVASQQMQYTPALQQTEEPLASQQTQEPKQTYGPPGFPPKQRPFAVMEAQSTPVLQQTESPFAPGQTQSPFASLQANSTIAFQQIQDATTPQQQLDASAPEIQSMPAPPVDSEDAQAHHAIPEQATLPYGTGTSHQTGVAEQAQAHMVIPEQATLPDNTHTPGQNGVIEKVPTRTTIPEQSCLPNDTDVSLPQNGAVEMIQTHTAIPEQSVPKGSNTLRTHGEVAEETQAVPEATGQLSPQPVNRTPSLTSGVVDKATSPPENQGHLEPPKLTVTYPSPPPQPKASTTTKTKSKGENRGLMLLRETHDMAKKQLLQQEAQIQQADRLQDARMKTVGDEIYHIKKGLGILHAQSISASEGIEALQQDMHQIKGAMTNLEDKMQTMLDLFKFYLQAQQPNADVVTPCVTATRMAEKANSSSLNTRNVPSDAHGGALKRKHDQMAPDASAEGDGQPETKLIRVDRASDGNEADATTRGVDDNGQPGGM